MNDKARADKFTAATQDCTEAMEQFASMLKRIAEITPPLYPNPELAEYLGITQGDDDE